ncbi:ribonuclease H-like protein [Athelia psychrophila]|uniref:Ribonuclease H-like protein n=1 Tax=Athelia psychrophila TaxID=1759441 RepID=A0A167WAS5_9AGAM|nr:ribonuclease H-like protein [Fibularhizoctonia sp. CBS 109695]
MMTDTIVLLSDSKNLVDGMTKYIHTWKENGWKTAAGKPVVNQEDFKELDALIEAMADPEHGLDVEFWHVKRKYNRLADKLATKACAA